MTTLFLSKFFANKYSIACINLQDKAKIQDGGVFMDQNKKNKIKEFFKKEGFYVVLFVCLCVVAVVATIATRSTSNETVENTNNEFTLDVSDKDTASTNNSNTNNSKSDNKSDEKKNEDSKTTNNKEEDVQTSTGTIETVLYFPVEGTLTRGYQEAMYSDSKTEARVDSSIHIAIEQGTDVKAAGAGEVIEVAKDSADRGAYVKVKHTDGRVTVYGNLAPEILVNKGDQVTNATVLGKVGSTSKLYSNSELKDDLQFELYRADGSVMDPTRIFQYEKAN